MPDSRRHRGAHPQDHEFFAAANLPALRQAVADLSWLLTREYAPTAALKLVGDRFRLTDRQRRAVARSACSDDAMNRRSARKLPPSAHFDAVEVDGYNLLITLESALSGGVVLVGRDGCSRDLASVHGTYRHVEETVTALRLIIEAMRRRGILSVRWLLDRPVSNSGRLKTLMASILEEYRWAWDIVLCDSPDAELMASPRPVVTSDSVVIERCSAWFDFAGELIATHVPSAWILDLREDERL